MAQGFEGAAAELQFQHYDNGEGFDVNSVEGNLDAAWSFGTIGAQVGLIFGKEVDSSADIDFRSYNGIAMHLTADVSDPLRLGVMVVADNFADGISLVAAEALYLDGPLRLEGRIGDSLDSDYDNRLVEAKGSYALGEAFKLRGGLFYGDYGDGVTYQVYTVGLGYDIAPGAEVYADLSRHNYDYGPGEGEDQGHLIKLGVRFNLGGDGERLFSFQPLN